MITQLNSFNGYTKTDSYFYTVLASTSTLASALALTNLEYEVVELMHWELTHRNRPSFVNRIYGRYLRLTRYSKLKELLKWPLTQKKQSRPI